MGGASGRDGWTTDTRPVRRVRRRDGLGTPGETWPATIPAVRDLLEDGLDLGEGVTFLVGENGAGKSTIVEAIAVAYGLPPEGGTMNGGEASRPSESPLAGWLQLERAAGAARSGFFLRAETMHGYFSYLESLPDAVDTDLHELSHGESFSALLERKIAAGRHRPGLVCLDEPEAALSFQSTLRWIADLSLVVEEGTQVLCATHSPVLCSIPGARILELGEWGMRESAWEDLDLVRHWRSYLDDPVRYLRHLL